MEILTAAGTGTPKLAVDLASAATPPAKPQKDKLHPSPPRILDTHLGANPLPKLVRTKARLDIPYEFQYYLQSSRTSAAHTGNSMKCFKSLLFPPLLSILFPP